MIYVRMSNGRAVEARSEAEMDATNRRHHALRFENRNDWKTMERAETVARELTEATGTLFLGIDNGPNVSPRYDVIEAPVLGADVSRSFNGDSYPEGTITKISASLRRIETSTGVVFFRKRQSGIWSDETFVMIRGHVYEQNPSF